MVFGAASMFWNNRKGVAAGRTGGLSEGQVARSSNGRLAKGIYVSFTKEVV